MTIYMKAANFAGSVNAKGFLGAAELMSIGSPAERRIQQTPGFGAQREMSHLKLGHIQISKAQDASSPTLYHYFCSAKNIPNIELYHLIFMHDMPEWRSKLTLSNVMISQFNELYSPEGSIELIDLAYTKIEKGYKQQKENGQFQAPSMSGYNIETAMVM